VIPTAVDPSAAPEGYSTLELLALVPNEEARSWFPTRTTAESADLDACRRSDAYAARKRQMGDGLIAAAKTVIPDLEERIVYRCEASPITFQRYAWTQDGSIYGTRGTKARIPNKTPMRNLVLAGAATHGPGIEAVVISGAYAAEALVPGTLSAAVEATSALSHEIASSPAAPLELQASD
jgi:phytoene dehydrogenase-like protein